MVVGIVHPDGHLTAVRQGQRRSVVRLDAQIHTQRHCPALIVGQGDGRQDQHVGGDEHHRCRKSGADPVPPLAPHAGAKQLSRLG